MKLSIHSPDELVAAIPHLLGFQPKESIVFLLVRSDLPVARVDILTTARDREGVWQSISDAFRRYAQPDSNVAIVGLSADREQAHVVGKDFAARLGTIGIGTPILLWADETRWADLDTGDMGLRTDAARGTVAAATVLSGRARPAASRESLAESLVGDREPVSALLPETRATARENAAKVEGRWALVRMQRFQRDGIRLSDADAARLLVAVESTPTRAFKTNELHLTRHYEQLSINRFRHIPADGNRFDIPEELLADCWKKHKTGSGDVMERLNFGKPSVTIRTEFFKPEKGRYLHPTEHRALTHHEAARIQGFPDDYKWVGSKVAIARQIGNAVPIPLAHALGAHLVSALDAQ